MDNNHKVKIEIEELTEPQIFNPPKKLLTWGLREGKIENLIVCEVVAILPDLPYHANVVCVNDNRVWWASHCAEIRGLE